MLAFRNLSGQLSRRSVDIHFPRYRADSAEDRKVFVNIVHSFQRKLPLPDPPDLVSHWEFLYERTFGCVGMLKQWLVRALAATLRRGDPTFTVRDLEAQALSVSQCDKIFSEVAEGEARLNEADGTRSKLRARMGLVTPTTTTLAGGHAAVNTNRHKPKPGHRRPVRDPVGTVHVAST